MMRFSKELYPKIALMKSAYAFTDRAYIHLDADDLYYYAEVLPKQGCEDISEKEFINEMLSQSVRHEVYRQTKTLRELLVARAVASSVIQAPIAEPYEADDFDSEYDEDTLAAEILKDWFDSGENA